jgi:hypothetical protein
MVDQHPVKMSWVNESGSRQQIVLEPWGEVHELKPGDQLGVEYNGGRRMTIDLTPTGVTIWAEDRGTLDVSARLSK